MQYYLGARRNRPKLEMPTKPVHFFRGIFSQRKLSQQKFREVVCLFFVLSKKDKGHFKFTHKTGPANITGTHSNVYRQGHFKLKTCVGAEIEIRGRKSGKKIKPVIFVKQ